MATIDVGLTPVNRGAASSATHSLLDLNNPANDTGSLDTFEIWAATNLSGTKIGTFSGSGTSWTVRDYESIGNVTSGSKQTFTGKNCNVSTNDVLGIYFSGGTIERDTSGFGGVGVKLSTDVFGGGTNTYNISDDDAFSIYATGATAAAGNPYYYYLQQ
jgi:nicotinic acid phosphoribosyltransferase